MNYDIVELTKAPSLSKREDGIYVYPPEYVLDRFEEGKSPEHRVYVVDGSYMQFDNTNTLRLSQIDLQDIFADTVLGTVRAMIDDTIIPPAPAVPQEPIEDVIAGIVDARIGTFIEVDFPGIIIDAVDQRVRDVEDERDEYIDKSVDKKLSHIKDDIDAMSKRMDELESGKSDVVENNIDTSLDEYRSIIDALTAEVKDLRDRVYEDLSLMGEHQTLLSDRVSTVKSTVDSVVAGKTNIGEDRLLNIIDKMITPPSPMYPIPIVTSSIAYQEPVAKVLESVSEADVVSSNIVSSDDKSEAGSDDGSKYIAKPYD